MRLVIGVCYDKIGKNSIAQLRILKYDAQILKSLPLYLVAYIRSVYLNNKKRIVIDCVSNKILLKDGHNEVGFIKRSTPTSVDRSKVRLGPLSTFFLL